MSAHNDDRYGFRWGPFRVTRFAELKRPHGVCRVLAVEPDRGPAVEIYVSPTSSSVRVFRDGKELT